MIYSEFVDFLKHSFHQVLGPNIAIQFHSLTKNNGIQRDCLCLLPPEENCSPAIYLEDYWKKYQQGFDEKEIFEEMLQHYSSARRNYSPVSISFHDFSLIRPQLFLKLIHKKRNVSLLQDIPHRVFLDLALVYGIYHRSDTLPHASALIRNEHLEIWNINENQLHQAAIENCRLLFPPLLTPLENLMEKFFSDPLPPFSPFSDSLPLYVLTNNSCYLGASCLLYPQVLSTFSREYPEGFYLIPSSIHEVLLLPRKPLRSLLALEHIVHEVNEQACAPEDILSDRVYEYIPEIGLLLDGYLPVSPEKIFY